MWMSLVWCGLVRFGMDELGLVCHSMVSCDVVWYGVVLQGRCFADLDLKCNCQCNLLASLVRPSSSHNLHFHQHRHCGIKALINGH